MREGTLITGGALFTENTVLYLLGKPFHKEKKIPLCYSFTNELSDSHACQYDTNKHKQPDRMSKGKLPESVGVPFTSTTTSNLSRSFC